MRILKSIYPFFLLSLTFLFVSCEEEAPLAVEEVKALLINSEWEVTPTFCAQPGDLDTFSINLTFGEDRFGEYQGFLDMVYEVGISEKNAGRALVRIQLASTGPLADIREYEVIDYEENQMIWTLRRSGRACSYEVLRIQ